MIHEIKNAVQGKRVAGAAAIAGAMLALSFTIMLVVNLLQWWVQRREGKRV